MFQSLTLAVRRPLVPAKPVNGGVLVPAVRVVSVFPLVPLVVVPVARRVAALAAGIRLLACVPQHVAFQVHALVARVAADAAVEGLGARVDALVAPQVGKVPTGVAARWALVRFLASVDPHVAL